MITLYGAPDLHDEVRTGRLEGAAEVYDGFDEEGGVVGADAVGDELVEVAGVEAEEGEEGEGVGVDDRG
ncbi:hypothetical protein MRB53_003315 [Persea americana]|uniref:Uncharacterized protein n=1 Tax=Persea americana TaxID=3435 RepID=A0ACC2MWV3_PERAE|nr:hypothetical protein MRB53_003315 [Persea americana]